jgi:N-acetylmuramoyl-L-alanine amidase
MMRGLGKWKKGRGLLPVALLCLSVLDAAAFSFWSGYTSPYNRTRPLRASTGYIVLHTTEGGSKGALRKLSDLGEAHYLVAENGHIYRILDDRKVAYHAGRSMWQGRENLDKYSIGIEVAGYHNRPVKEAQCRALRELLSQLKRKYGITDERVLTHSMVAYGAPNRWRNYSHRGRKRCGMQFADTGMRQRLGLFRKPVVDPDVVAGRVKVGDAYLAQKLYGPAWAQQLPRSVSSGYAAAKSSAKPGVGVVSASRPSAPSRALRMISQTGQSPASLVGDIYDDAETLYIYPSGNVMKGSLLSDGSFHMLPAGTRILVGYGYCGRVTPQRSPTQVCGSRWSDGQTLYLLPNGSFRKGDVFATAAVPKNTMVFLPL